MADELLSVVIVLGAALVAGAVGLALGIFVFAPRINRALDRAHEDDEETGDAAD